MRKLIVVFILLFPSIVNAQYFNDGQDRSTIKWKRISSPNFEVIFPHGFEEKAEHIANLMEASYKYTIVSLNHKPKKISIILHTETVKSNAFLGWAPARIEMYTTPHQRIYSQDWLEQLAIHELRHMVQLSKIEEEMPKILKFLFGEQAATLLTAIYLPFWFIEGDAVGAETGLSYSGRGRQPDFQRELRAQIIDKGIFSYDKAYLGSYKDRVANHYHLGYFITSSARMLYKKVVWDEVLSQVAKNPLAFNSFDKGLKKSIGLNKIQLYDTVFNYLAQQWETEDSKIEQSEFQYINKTNNIYSDYKYGFRHNDSLVIAQKTNKNNITSFIKIGNDKKEKSIYKPGFPFIESVYGKDSLLVWSERLPHIRWYHADKSLIKILNCINGKTIEYVFDRKLFSPKLSPSNKSLITVEANQFYQFYLSTIDLNTGTLNQIYSFENDYFITPSWSKNEEEIITVVLRNNQKAIARINLITKQSELLIPFNNQEIIQPIEDNNGNIYFIGGFSGIDNVYVLRSDDKKVYEIVTSRFGISDISLLNNELIYSNYTSNGYQLAKVNIDSLELKERPNIESTISSLIATEISKQEPGIIDFTINDSIKYVEENFSKTKNLINFHSWAPISIDPYNHSIYPGVSLMSQNLLSTAEFMVGYRFRWEDNQGEFYSKFNYYGWFPVIEFEALNGNRNTYYNEIQKTLNTNNETFNIDTIQKVFGLNETTLKMKVYVPLNLSKGKYYSKIQPSLNYNLTNNKGKTDVPKGFPLGYYQTLETRLYAYKILKSSDNDLLPNFGAIIDLSYATTLKGVADFGHIFSISSLLYLPGIAQTHGITLFNGYQQKVRAEYSFADNIRFPRGHHSIINNGMYSFGIDYQLPLYYPDISIGRWIYLRRIKLKAFYDQAFFNNNNQQIINNSESIQSTGIELSTDCNFLRFIAPIEIGFRASYLYNKQFSFDYLFNIQFSF